MIGNKEDLDEIWDILDTCCERSEKYMSEALKLIVQLRQYKMSDSPALRDFNPCIMGRCNTPMGSSKQPVGWLG